MEKIKTIVIIILYILTFSLSMYAGYYKTRYEIVREELTELRRIK